MNTIKQGSTVKATSKKLTKQLPAHVSVFGEVVRVIPKQPKKHQTYEVYWFVDCIGFKSRNKFVTGRSVAVVHPWTPTIESFVDSILLEVAHGDDDCPDLIDDGTPEVTPSRENLSPPTPPMFLDSCSDTDPEWNLRPRDPFRWKIVRCHRPGRPPFFYYNEGLNMTSWTMPRDEGGDKEGDEKGDESMVVIEEPCVREGDGADDEEDEDEEDEDEEDEDELDLDVPIDVNDDLMKARIFRNKCPKTINNPNNPTSMRCWLCTQVGQTCIEVGLLGLFIVLRHFKDTAGKPLVVALCRNVTCVEEHAKRAQE